MSPTAAGDLAGRHVVVQGAGVDLEGAAAQHERQLQPEELVEDEAAAGRLDDVERLGPWMARKASVRSHRSSDVAPLGGQRVGELAGPLERLLDELADLPADVSPTLAEAG